LLQGKFVKDWCKLNGVYLRKQKVIRKQEEQLRVEKEKARDLYWDPTWQKKKEKKEIQKKPKQKADVFQRVFESIMKTVRELWLERNTDRHRPLQGQKRIAKLTEATQTVTDLYSLRSLIMPQHDSKYFALSLEEMLEQSAPRMLTWATRWKIGIYQSIRRTKILSKKLTVPLWTIWEPDRTDEPKKKVDRRRVIESRTKVKKYKVTKITNKLKVKDQVKSTSRAPAVVAEKTY